MDLITRYCKKPYRTDKTHKSILLMRIPECGPQSGLLTLGFLRSFCILSWTDSVLYNRGMTELERASEINTALLHAWANTIPLKG